MGLEPLRASNSRHLLRLSFVVISFWSLWLCFISTLHLSFLQRLHITLSGTGFVILFGAFWWSLSEGLAFLFIVSLIYRAFSLTPSGLYFLSMFIIFFLFRFLSQRFSVRTRSQLALSLFATALGLELVQSLILREVYSGKFMSFRLVASIFLSALFQAFIGLLLAKPLMSLLAKR